MVKLPGRRQNDDEQPNRKDNPRDPGAGGRGTERDAGRDRSPVRGDRPWVSGGTGSGAGGSVDDDDFNFITGKVRTPNRDLGTVRPEFTRSTEQKPDADSGGGGWLRRGRDDKATEGDAGRRGADRPAQPTGRYTPPDDKRNKPDAKSARQSNKRGGFLGLGRGKDQDDKAEKKPQGGSPFVRGDLDERSRTAGTPDRGGIGTAGRDRYGTGSDVERPGGALGSGTRDRYGTGGDVDRPGGALGSGTRERYGTGGDVDRPGGALGSGTRDRYSTGSDVERPGGALGSGTRDRYGTGGDVDRPGGALGSGTRDRFGASAVRDTSEDLPRSASQRSPYSPSPGTRPIVGTDRAADKGQDTGEKKRASLFGRNKDKKDTPEKDTSRPPSRKGDSGTYDRVGGAGAAGTAPRDRTGGALSGYDRAGGTGAVSPTQRDRAAGTPGSYDRAGGATAPRTTMTGREPAGRPEAPPGRTGRPDASRTQEPPGRGTAVRGATHAEAAPRGQVRPLPGQKDRGAFTWSQGLDLDRKIDLAGIVLFAAALVSLISVLPSMTMGVMPEPTAGLTYTINELLSQLLGWGKVALPIAALVISVWLMKSSFRDRGFELDYFRLIGMLMLFACALGWLHMIELFDNTQPTVDAFRRISYDLAVEDGRGGGWIGHQVYVFLLSQLLDIGTIAVLIAWAVMGVMLTFDVSVVEIWAFVAGALGIMHLTHRGDRAIEREARQLLKTDQPALIARGATRGADRNVPLPLEQAAAAGLAAEAAARRGRWRSETPDADVLAERPGPRINRRTGAVNGDALDGADTAPDAASGKAIVPGQTPTTTPAAAATLEHTALGARSPAAATTLEHAALGALSPTATDPAAQRTRTMDPARTAAEMRPTDARTPDARPGMTRSAETPGDNPRGRAERALDALTRPDSANSALLGPSDDATSDEAGALAPARRRMPHMPRTSSNPAVDPNASLPSEQAERPGSNPLRPGAAVAPAVLGAARETLTSAAAPSSQASGEPVSPRRGLTPFARPVTGSAADSGLPAIPVAPGRELPASQAPARKGSAEDAAGAEPRRFPWGRRGQSDSAGPAEERASGRTLTPSTADAAMLAASASATADNPAPARRGGLLGGLRRAPTTTGTAPDAAAERASGRTATRSTSDAAVLAASATVDNPAPARRGGLLGGLRRAPTTTSTAPDTAAEHASGRTPTPSTTDAAVLAASASADDPAPARRGGLLGGLRRTAENAASVSAAAASDALPPASAAAPARLGGFLGGLRRGTRSEDTATREASEARAVKDGSAAETTTVAAPATGQDRAQRPSESATPTTEDRPRRVPRFANPLDALVSPDDPPAAESERRSQATTRTPDPLEFSIARPAARSAGDSADNRADRADRGTGDRADARTDRDRPADEQRRGPGVLETLGALGAVAAVGAVGAALADRADHADHADHADRADPIDRGDREQRGDRAEPIERRSPIATGETAPRRVDPSERAPRSEADRADRARPDTATLSAAPTVSPAPGASVQTPSVTPAAAAQPANPEVGSRLEELRRMREQNPNIPAVPPPAAGTETLPPRRMPVPVGMTPEERTARELGLPRPVTESEPVRAETPPASTPSSADRAAPSRVTSATRPPESIAPTRVASAAVPATPSTTNATTPAPRSDATPGAAPARPAANPLAGGPARRTGAGLGTTRPTPRDDDDADLFEDENDFDDELAEDELDPDEIVDTVPAHPDRPPLTVRRRSLEGRGPSVLKAPAEPAAAVAAGANAPQSRVHRPGKVTWAVPDFRKLLRQGEEQRINDEVLLDKARVIEDTLASFDAPAKVVEVNPGPVITQFGVEPDYLLGRGGRKVRVKVGQIARLDADLALALAARTIRIEAPVPGKGFVGIEVPNDEVSLVGLYDIMESPEFTRIDSKLRIALGLAVDGTPVAADLTAMPHLLIAGTTGSGKSVCVNSIIISLLLQNTPDDVQFIMVDPKRVELTSYNGIPHLVAPVVVELERIVGVLQWVQREMEERYRKFAAIAARNILDYNRKVGHDNRMPYYVVVVDELADLMMLAPDETERLLARLAQMARATGIHLIISTQRPSVDIITGLIKANFPARIAFAVASSVDSRVILDQPGAEKLLGRGDMLFQSPDAAAPLRMQGVYVSDEEIVAITRSWKGLMLDKADAAGQRGTLTSPSSDIKLDRLNAPPSTHTAPAQRRASGPGVQRDLWDADDTELSIEDDGGPDRDGLYEEAVELVQRLNKASISLLQRRLRIGYTRAARLIDMMENEGIVGGAQEGAKPREVLKRKVSSGDD